MQTSSGKPAFILGIALLVFGAGGIPYRPRRPAVEGGNYAGLPDA